MIDEELLKRIILERPKPKEHIKRIIKITYIDKIFSIIGPRRAGKTYFLYQIIDELVLLKRVERDKILYIDFEDDRLKKIETEDLQKIIDAYYILFPENKGKKVYFMFDEVQNAPSWQKFARRLHEKEGCEVYLTGSSAKLLSKEIATELRGRTWTYNIFPLSFREYLRFKGIEINKRSVYTEERYNIIKHFEDYIRVGGFPEVINLPPNERIILLQNYYETVMFRDVIDRYKLTNIDVVKNLFSYLVNNFARKFSVNKFYNILKSMNRAVSKDYLYPLLGYLEDTMYFFFVQIYSESNNVRMANPKKIYLIDTGLINSLIIKKEEEGWFYENIVAIELYRRGKEIYYYNNKNECDFIVTDKVNKETIPIQVSLDPYNDREINGLIEAAKRVKSSTGVIITKSDEKTIDKENIKIKLVPLWKWLLESQS